MKKKYLLPGIYLLLVIASLLIPALYYLLFIAEAVVAIIMLAIPIYFNGPRDTTYFVIAGTAVQFFLIGYLWDKISERYSSKNRLD
jgi:hypothetical protein